MLPRKRDQLLAFAIENGVDLGALLVHDVAGQGARRHAGALAVAAEGERAQAGQAAQLSQRSQLSDQAGAGRPQWQGERADASQAR